MNFIDSSFPVSYLTVCERRLLYGDAIMGQRLGAIATSLLAHIFDNFVSPTDLTVYCWSKTHGLLSD